MDERSTMLDVGKKSAKMLKNCQWPNIGLGVDFMYQLTKEKVLLIQKLFPTNFYVYS
jgi:hypothetical protein